VKAPESFAGIQRSRRFWLSLVALTGFIAGLAVSEARVVLTRPLHELAHKIKDKFLPRGRSESDAAHLIAKQYRDNQSRIALDRELDTALLPFRIRSLPANATERVAAVSGGVTMVGRRLLIMDRLGSFFQCADDCSEITKAPIPSIPNNIVQYASEPDPRIDEKSFRAHSVRFSSSMNMLAVSHEYFDPTLPSTRFAVSVIELDPDTLQPGAAWATVFLSEPEPHGSNDEAGGALAWGSAGKLFVAVGEYGTEAEKAQDPNSAFGKIFEIDVRSQSHRLVALGFRNPEGLALSETLGLIAVQHGPEGGDRLDQVTEGGNYGWPNVTLGTEYHRYSYEPNPDVGRLGGFLPPIFAWVPSIAPSGMIEARDFDKRWDGDLLVASLKGQRLYRLRPDHGRVVYSEPIFIGKRIRDLAAMKPGVLALWTDDAQIIVLSVDREKLAADRRLPFVRSQALIDSCMFCHHFGKTNESDFAPSLSGVFGRPIASDRFLYSAGLRRIGGVWTADSLRRFLSDPDGFASGTSMPNPQIAQVAPNQIDEIVADLERLAREPSEGDVR
jgi:cytochrome c2